MMKLILLPALLLGFLLFPVVTVNAQNEISASERQICQGVGAAFGEKGCERTNKKSANQLIRTAVDILSLVVGVIAVIMVIVGGLKYITSGGDSTSISSAKNTILYAVIGLVIVGMAQIIVRFVVGRVS